MTKPLDDHQIDHLIADYLDGSLSESDRAAFEGWLRASSEHPRRVARLSATDYAIREVCQDTRADYLLDALQQIEEAAEPAQIVDLTGVINRDRCKPSKKRESGQLSTSDLLSAGQYLLSHSLTPKVIAGLATAAALLLSVILLIVLSGGESNEPPLTQTPTPKRAFSAQSVVATLTASHNAQWAERAIARGSELRSGQILTLTAGFAEITTQRGGVVVLEAPAQVELVDNNALRLHAGKLVGICETESSKGFLVRTPHMDVTDLGTRFGVDSRAPGMTDVFVYEGEIEVARSTSSDAEAIIPYRITTGQAMRADSRGRIATLDPSDHNFNLLPAIRLSDRTAYETVVAELKPVAWWRHAQASSRSSILGDIAFLESQPGKLGTAVFNGEGTLDAGDVLGFEADQSFTISCWIRPKATKATFIAGRISRNEARGIHGYDLYLYEGQLLFQLKHAYAAPGNPESAIRVAATPRITPDRWTHVTAVYGGSRQASGVQLYINGQSVPVAVRSDSLGENSIQADTTFRMGIRGYALPRSGGADLTTDANGAPFVGGLGEVIVFDRALSEPGVESIYQASQNILINGGS